MDSSELAVIGLTCNLVGVFFLANSIIFRRTRKVIEEFFGVGAGSLAAVRDYSLNKIQVVIGFLFLNTGFLLQGFAVLDALKERITTVIVCLVIVGFAGIVYLIGLTYSRRNFRRYLRDFFHKHPWDFEQNMALTQEIGVFLGVRHRPDMSVADYVREVRRALELPRELERGIRAASTVGRGDAGRRLRDDVKALPGR
ncbi:MAG: hypothetical protein IPM29_16560 [Planctomycetes bacterium]|nr:hypothetical protein [Planctomycetota bacterium]